MNPTKPNPIDYLEKNIDGSIFNEGIKDYINYLITYSLSIFFFIVSFNGWYYIFEKVLKKKDFLEKNDKERSYYVSLWNSNTHHLVVFILAIYNLAFPDCGGSGKPFEWFYNEKCFLTTDKRMVHSCIFACGYLTVDFVI